MKLNAKQLRQIVESVVNEEDQDFLQPLIDEMSKTMSDRLGNTQRVNPVDPDGDEYELYPEIRKHVSDAVSHIYERWRLYLEFRRPKRK